ncbi:MAG: hypothetical protein IJC71_05685 [Clostridia bacterium]|nr:hypothetical protein [Clostridia bacterium]
MKIFAFLLLLAILCSFSGCREESPDPSENGSPSPDSVQTQPNTDEDTPNSKDTEPEPLPDKTEPAQSAASDAPTAHMDIQDTAPAAEPVSVYKLKDEEYTTYMDFAVRLFTASYADEKRESNCNMMISPLSVISALGLTQNGAAGETLTEMETAFGLDRDTQNAFLASYLPTLPVGEGYKLTAANSVWYRTIDALRVQDTFVKAAKELYNAEVRPQAFDEQTCLDMNAWVSEHTDGMIREIIDPAMGIPDDAMLYLINALAFDSMWEQEYRESQVRGGIFTTESGETQNIDMMYSSESRYLKSDDALGFLRFYKDEKYAFVGLLPNEGIPLDDYVSSLTGEKLAAVLSKVHSHEVSAQLPKFTASYGVSMNDYLMDMGITTLFDQHAADLSDMAVHDTLNLYVSDVMHKTFISVDEKGTKAAAVTAVEVCVEESVPEPPIQIWLNRPFVYMIVEWENRVPVFIGTVESLAE